MSTEDDHFEEHQKLLVRSIECRLCHRQRIGFQISFDDTTICLDCEASEKKS